jgi:hypothetical protein
LVNLAAGSYTDIVARPPAGVKLVLNGISGSTTIFGSSPALTVESGTVLVENITLTTSTDSPTILVTGGNLALREDTVEGTTLSAPAVVSVESGTLDLGTALDHGNNTLDVNNDSPPIQSGAGSSVTAVGNIQEVRGVPFPKDYVAQAFLDLNGNGMRDPDEPGLAGRAVYFDEDGNGEAGPTEPHWTTDADGVAVLEGILPDQWTLRFVTIPGESVSTAATYDLTVAQSGMEINLGVRPTTSESFVAALYRDLLKRLVDTEGLAFWSAALDGGMTPAQLVLAIQTDAGHEYYQREVHDLFVTFLGREPLAADNPGQYVDLLARGATPEQLATLFAASDEFFQQQGGGSNGGLVNALYLAAFGTPDRVTSDPGAMHWQQELANASLSRSQLAAIIFSSAEYRQAVIQGDYHTFFNRDADSGGLEYWSRQLANGGTDGQVLAAMLGDAGNEYFNRTTA